MSSHYDRMNELVKEVEATKNDLMIDQAAFLMGMFKGDWNIDPWVEGCPKVKALMPEMDAERVQAKRLLACSGWMNREDALGYLADNIRKMEQNR